MKILFQINYSIFIIIFNFTVLLYSFSIDNIFKLSDLKLIQAYDIKFQQNSNIAYITAIDYQLKKRFVIANFDHKNFSIINEYVVPISYRQPSYLEQINFYESSRIIILDKLTESMTQFDKNGNILNQQIFVGFNYSQILISQKSNRIFRINTQRTIILFDNIDNFISDVKNNFYLSTVNILNTKLIPSLHKNHLFYYILFENLLSPPSYSARIIIYDLFSSSLLLIHTIHQVKKDLKIIKSLDLKFIYYNYFVSSTQQNKICKYDLLIKSQLCHNFNNNIIIQKIQNSEGNTMIIYGYNIDLLLQNYKKEIVITLMNMTDFSIIFSIKYVNSYRINKVLIFNHIDSIKIVEFADNLTEIKVIYKCQNGLYYDNCLGKCTIYHQFCINMSKQGCNCKYSLEQNNQNLNQSKQQIQTRTVELFKDLLKNSFQNQITTTVNQIPGIRSYFKPLGCLLINFDNLWLYYYHSANYNIIIQETFSIIRQMQEQKWKIFGLNKVWQNMQMNNSKRFLQYKFNYTSNKYVQIQGVSNQFYVNILHFIFPNYFFIILIFIVTKIIRFVSKKLYFSIFKQFSMWQNFIFITLEGNIQYFSFLIGFQFKNLFANDFIEKISILSIVCLFFCTIFFLVTIFFFLRLKNKKITNYFFQNIDKSNSGSFYLVCQKGLKHIILGFIHIIIEQMHGIRLKVLLIFQILCLFQTIFNLRQKKIIKNIKMIWIDSFGSFIRIILITIFYFEKVFEFQQLQIMKPLFSILLISYTLESLLLFIMQLAILLIELFKNISSKIQQFTTKQKQSQKIPSKKKIFTLKTYYCQPFIKKQNKHQQLNSEVNTNKIKESNSAKFISFNGQTKIKTQKDIGKNCKNTIKSTQFHSNKYLCFYKILKKKTNK